MAGGSVLDLSSVRRLVAAEHGLAVVCATRGDGTVQTSLVNAGITADQRDRREVVGFVARGDAVKLRHFRARPYANIVWRSGWEWVAIEGSVTLIGPDNPLPGFATEDLPALLRTIYVDAGGEHDDWDEYDRVMAAERRTAVLITPTRMSTNG
jgi:PPOX class probable F420-dependent enzyme